MKIKLLICLAALTFICSCNFFGGSYKEKDIVGTWSRPINSGITATITNDDGTTSTIDQGPVSDEFFRFNEDMTFQMWERPRSGNPDFYNVTGTWKVAEDKNSVDIYINGNHSNLKVVKIKNDKLYVLATDGSEIEYVKN